MTSADLHDTALYTLWAWLLVDAMWVFTKHSFKAKSADRGSLWWLIFFLWVGIALAAFQSYTTVGSFGATAVPVQLFGLVVMAFGIGIRFVSIRQLGKLHMPVVAIQADHPLMDRGLYSRVRHPSYLGAIMALTGFGLALGNWLSTLAVFVATLFSYSYRIYVEEKALVAGLGDRYLEYSRRTKRLIPWVF